MIASQSAFESPALPILSHREYLAGGRIKGSILRAHLTWAREWAGPERFGHLVDSLSPELQSDIAEVVLSTSWYPFARIVDLDRRIVATLGEGDRRILRQTGRYAAYLVLSKSYRSFDPASQHSFFRQLSLLQTQFQDFGSATYEKVGANRGRMSHRFARCFSQTSCESTIGFYEECARLHGGREIQVTEPACRCLGAPGCTFDIQWR